LNSKNGATAGTVSNWTSRWASRLGIALGVMLTPSLAHASACYVDSEFTTDQLIYLSDSSDASTARVVGPFGVPEIETLAKDPVTQNLYSADADTFGVIDLETGAYNLIGSFGTALAANGDLTVDVLLDDIMGGGNDYLIITGGPVDDLAIDSTGALYISYASQLATADLNGVGTVASVVAPSPFGAGIIDMEGLSVDINDNLIGSSGTNGTPATINALWDIDKVTGVATLRSMPGVLTDYEGVACFFSEVDVELTKDVALTTDADASGYFSTGDRITYTISVSNDDANALVSEVQVTDDLSGITGLTFVSASDDKPANSSYDSATGVWTVGVIPPKTVFNLSLVYDVGPGAVPVVVNTAEVTAAANPDPDSTPDNDDGDQSEDDEDNAQLPLNPEIGVTKAATAIGALQSDGTFDVEYTVLVENTGGAALSNLSLTDDLSLPTQLGSAFNGVTVAPVVSLISNASGNTVLPTTAGAAFTGTGTGTNLLLGTDGTLGLADQYQVVFSVNVDPNASGAPAALDNTITAAGSPPGGTPVTDDSNTGTDITGAGTGEVPSDNPGGPGAPTPIQPPDADDQIGVVKSATTIGPLQGDGTFDVTYTILVENTGKSQLTSLTLVDDLSAPAQLGTAFNGVTAAPVVSIANNVSGTAVAPTTNGAAFTGTGAGTALVIGTDGLLESDDQYQVVFSVNIDPNATGAPAALNNIATAGGTPPSGTPVTDDSNSGTDVDGASTGELPTGNAGGPGFATPVKPPAPDDSIGVVKSATTISALHSDGTFDVTYTLLIENTGKTILTPLTLVDDLSDPSQLGTAFNGITAAPVVTLVTNTSGNAVAPTTSGATFTGNGTTTALIIGTDGRIDPGDQYEVVFTANIDPNIAGAPAALDNTATAGGTPPSGTPVMDDSNTGTDIDGAPTGEVPSDNPAGPGVPTPITPPTAVDSIGVVKSATTIGALQTDGTFDVTYTLLIENTGGSILTSLTLVDDLSAATQLGSAFNGITAAPVVTLVNNATGNAVAPTTNGAAFTGTGSGTALIIGTDGRIDPGDQYQVEFTANIDTNAAGAPTALDNTATAGATPPSGTPISDDSNTGTDVTGGGTGEVPTDNPGGPGSPTPITPPASNPEIGVTKGVSLIGPLQTDGTFDVSYTVIVENTGGVELTPLTLTDDLSAASLLGTAFNGVVSQPVVSLLNSVSGTAIAPSTNGAAFTGTGAGTGLITGTDGLLGVGDQIQVDFTVNIDPNAAGAPSTLLNTAVAGGQPPSGGPVSDDSNTATDLTGGNTGEVPADNPGGPGVPTPVAPPGANPGISVIKSATSVGALQIDGTFDVAYELVVTNTGNQQLDPLTLTDDLSASGQLGSAFNGVTVAPVVNLTNNASGNAVAPTTAGAAFTGDASGSGLILGTDGVLGPNDEYIVTFSVNIDPNAPGAPALLANTATAGGTPPSGTPVTDDSDTGTDPDGNGTGVGPGDNPDGPGSPTIVTPPTSNPQIGVVKSAVSVGALQADGTLAVDYEILVENTGDVSLTSLTLSDDLSAANQLGSSFNGILSAPVVSVVTNASGNALAPTSAGAAFTGTAAGSALLTGTDGRIDPTDQYLVTFTVSINPTAAGAPTAFENTATATGTDPSDTVVTDDSNTGTDIDGNLTGETPVDNPGGPGSPTPVAPPVGNGEIGLTKGVTAISGLLPDGTFNVTYQLLAENTGTSTLTALRLTDNLEDPANLGSAFVSVTAPPVVTQVSNATGNSVVPTSTGVGFTGRAGGLDVLTGTTSVLEPNDQFAVEFTVNIDPNAVGAPTIFNNSATVSGTVLGTVTVVSDDSNTTTDIDGNATGELPTTNPGGPGNPTPVAPPVEDAQIGLAKSAVVGGLLGDGTFDVTFTLLAENLGNVQLSMITLSDDLSAASNLGSAFVGLRTPPAISLINISGGSVVPTLDTSFNGTAAAPNILIGTDGLLLPGDQFEVVFTATIDPNAPGAPADLVNQATVGGTSPGGETPEDLSDDGSQTDGPNAGGTDNDPTPIAVPVLTPLVVVKTTTTPEVQTGGFASYEVSVTNPSAFGVTNITLEDDLPGGFAYVEDSAQLFRAGVASPAVVTGIDPITTQIGNLSAGETVTVTYTTRVGAGVVTGEHVNTVQALASGVPASNTAVATVVLGEDPLLSTTRVIGKVWHDRDGDGWQDAAWATGIKLVGGPFGEGKKLDNLPGRSSDSDESSAPSMRLAIPGSWNDLDQIRLTTAQGTVLYINNQGAVEERHRGQKKRGKTAQDLRVKLVSNRLSQRDFARTNFLEIRNLGVQEEGLPGVRLATIEGLLIETDQAGRYHIEEIENVAWDIGSNFIVKVDPQTLPDGHEFTTENPRVLRLTQSLMSDISFGVRIPKGSWQVASCPAPSPIAAAPVSRPQGGVTLRTEPLTVIRFESGESKIDASQLSDIQLGLDRWAGQQNLRLRFTGHTDNEPLGAPNRAKYGDNMGLSEARAERVAQKVGDALGVDRSSMILVGFGDAMPVADNSMPEGRAQNRRVTVEATFEIPDALPEPVVAAAAPVAVEGCDPAAFAEQYSGRTLDYQPEPVTETILDKVSEVRFASGKSDISEAALNDLRRRIDELSGKENLRVRFIGHTDNESLSARTEAIYGSNQGLSEARARQVAERVQETLGVSSAMVEISGRGDSQPIADNESREGMALNRRVEIVLVYDETTAGQPVVERSVPLDTFAASSLPTHGVVRAVEDRAQIDPRLAVVAETDYLTPQTQAVDFFRYSNYPAFVSRFEVNVFRASDIDRTRAIATLTETPNSQLDVSGSMTWTPELLRAGEEYVYVLSAFGENGELDSTYPRALVVLPADEKSANSEAVDPMSIYGTSALEVQSIPLTGGRVRVWGLDLAPAHTLTVAGEPMPLDETGKFVLEAHLPQGQYSLPVVNRNPAGPAMQQRLELEISDSYLFMVGLANVTFGGNDIDSAVEPLAADDRFSGSTYTSGRLGFYLKGKIRGKYLITAQLDSTEDELKNFGDNLRRQDPRSVFRRLEADQYYPVYGDDSTTFRDTESQGAGYVRVDWNKSKALWGNFETGITGNEFAQYNRSLYGAQLVYKTNAVTNRGENRISVTAFGSEANSVAAHNEFEATGGSLYYLRNTDIVRGSEKVWIEVRRRDTLVVTEQLALQPGVDYEFDHIQGRILLNRPLSQITRNRNDAIIRDRALEGDRVFLVTNYEYVPSGFDNDDITAGIRAKYWINSALALGGSYVNESRAGSDYTLAGGDLTFRHGKGTYVKLEGATSESDQTTSLFSSDGGLTFSNASLPTVGGTEGDAYGVEARVNLKDISDREGIAKAWFKHREEGFSSSRETQQITDTTDIGFEADLQVNKRLKVIARGNQLERDDLSEDRTISLQGEYSINKKLDVAAEVRDQQRELEVPAVGGGTSTINSDATLFGARINYSFDENTSAYVEGQTSTGESAAFESNDLIAVGIQTRVSEALGLGVEVSEGDRGSALMGSIDYRINDQIALDIGAGIGDGAYGTAGATINLDNGYQLYGSYGIDPDNTIDRQRNVTTIGQRLVLGNGAKLFNEHQWSRSESEDGVTNVFGIDYPINDYFSVSATLQRGELEFAGVETNRDAYSLGVAIQSDDLRLGSRVEYRRDESPANEFEQWLSSNAIEWKVSQSTRVLTKLNYSQTEDQLTGDDAARLAEGSVGVAYRPVWTDRFNVLARYTYLDDLVAPGQVILRPDQRSHVGSVESLYKLSSRWEFGLKLAIRRGEIRLNRDSGPWFDSGLDIAVGRARYHLNHKWDGLLEYRYVANSELDDARSGALIGAYRHIGKQLKFGAGYNFTDYSDDLTNLDYDNGGWFIDLIGKW